MYRSFQGSSTDCQSSSLACRHPLRACLARKHALQERSTPKHFRIMCIAERHGPRTIKIDEFLKDKQTGRGFRDANFPLDSEGRTYHLGTKAGEVAPRILSVGSSKRARLLTRFLQCPGDSTTLFEHESSRGFLTITWGV
eukprot:jgi/Botrbrau1/7752/Bobra.0159s0181.1